jgi:uncharacterized protein (TIGR00251 family)
VPADCIDEIDGDAVVRVHVQPRSGRAAVGPMHGDALRVRVQAPPVDGRATEAARDLIADTFGLPRSRVALVSGERSRIKRFRLGGLRAAAAAERLAVVLGPLHG